MKQFVLLSKKYYFFLIVLLTMLIGNVNAATITTTGSGNWNSTNVNAPWPGGTVPPAGSDIIIANGHTVTVSANVANNPATITINTGGQLTIGGFTITVTGITAVSGTLLINSNTNAPKIFTGLVTINSGGTWTSTVATTVSRVVFRGGITNNSTNVFSAGGATFNTNAQNLNGTGSFSFASVTVTGVTITNNGNLTVGTALAGNGTLTNSSTGTLNLSGAGAGSCAITTLANAGFINRSAAGTTTTALANFTNTGTINITGSGTITGITNNAGGIVNHSGSSTISSFNNATSTSVLNITALTVPTFTILTTTFVGNTVNYNGAGNQTVKAQTYSNLVLSGSGTKTIGTAASGILTSGNLSIAPTGNAIASVTNTNITVNSLTLGGNGAVNETWGSTSSVATNQDNTFFAGTTGYLNVTTNTCSPPAAPSTTGAIICVGTTTGTTLSASGAISGQRYRWYNASTGGTLLKTSTNNTDNSYTTPTISVTTNYWVSILSNGRCESARTLVTATFPSISPDDQNQAGTNSWIGHVYDGQNFDTYYGTITQTEIFDEGFGGDNTCFTVNSSLGNRQVNTESFSVKYRMTSNSRKGLYVVDLGSDDKSRLTIDGVLVYNNWNDQAWTSRPRVLINLSGSSSLLYEFTENSGQNRVVFLNLTQVLANSLSNNITQNICLGNAGSAISGDTYGTLPTGITLSGTGYQWAYSTTPGGTRTLISGATAATFAPNTASAPFNSPGTYYVYRNAVLVSTNNTGFTNYTTTNESNAATITVNPLPTATVSNTNSPICAGEDAVFTLTGTSGATVTYNINSGSNATVTLTGGTATVTVSAASAGQTLTLVSVTDGTCSQSLSESSAITVNPLPEIGSFN